MEGNSLPSCVLAMFEMAPPSQEAVLFFFFCAFFFNAIYRGNVLFAPQDSILSTEHTLHA